MEYLKRFYKIIFIILISITSSCNISMGEPDTGTITTTKLELIKISPIQQVYNQGDFITLKLDFPAINNYFDGTSINLLQSTNDYDAQLSLFFNQLFIDNEVILVKGNQGQYSNSFYVIYNPNNGNYELEVKIKLNRTGNYSFINGGNIIIRKSKYFYYNIDTNIEWTNNADQISFTVI